jgi:deoxyadenosine/deoxycytidine kinase
VLTDKHVFAAMLAESGEIDVLEMALYNSWYDSFAADLPIRGIIYVTTGVAVSHERIAQRGRAGEEAIGADYLAALSAQHEKWVDSTELPVLRLSTEPGSSMDECVAQVREFIAQLSADASGKPRAGGGASAMPGGGSPLKARIE